MRGEKNLEIINDELLSIKENILQSQKTDKDSPKRSFVQIKKYIFDGPKGAHIFEAIWIFTCSFSICFELDW